VIDDDAIAREVLINYIEESNSLELLSSFDEPVKAINFIENNKVDLIFLDIEMPTMSGIDVLKTLKNPPKIILVTSNENYAVESYDYDIVDFLIKPVSYARFKKSIDKLQFQNDSVNDTTIFVKTNSVFEKISLTDILYIEASVDYVEIITAKKKYLVGTTMNKILSKLPNKYFARVHRSYIVRLDKIEKIDGNLIEIENHIIRMSKSYKEDVLSKINMI